MLGVPQSLITSIPELVLYWTPSNRWVLQNRRMSSICLITAAVVVVENEVARRDGYQVVKGAYGRVEFAAP